MLGQLCLVEGGRGCVHPAELYGLPVLRAELMAGGFWGARRLRRAGKGLRRGGAVQLLAPEGLEGWGALQDLGLKRVEPDGFLKRQGAPLALAALERQDLAPDRATVALRGLRAGREMAGAAAALCPRVRRLVVDAPGGGAELAAWLRREFGIPVLPPGEVGQVALQFQSGVWTPEERTLELFGGRPDLGGLRLEAPCLAGEDRGDLPLLSVLWERGRLEQKDIAIL